MQRATSLLLLSCLSLALSGCGIKGGLKTPPPLWGPGSVQDSGQDTGEVPDENTTAESLDTSDDPLDEPGPGGPLDEPEDEDFGYGDDVTRGT
jgi:predicted small lipoprotein YifL